MPDLIDEEGFRANVAIVLSNDAGQLFWAGRAGRSGWQFPQGGILVDESPLDAMYRELHEEVGLRPDHVEVIGEVPGWLRYRLPRRYQRRRSEPVCVGQKQRWFLLRLRDDVNNVCLTRTDSPEFDRWCWVDFWYPLREVVYFKRRVYERALNHLAEVLFPSQPPPRRRVKRRSEVYRD